MIEIIPAEIMPVFATTEEEVEYRKCQIRKSIECKIGDMVKREKSLPGFSLVKNEDTKFVHELLVQARMLFIEGHFYACTAMCGVVGERIIKDIFLNNLMIGDEKSASRPTEHATEKLERIDLRTLIDFCSRMSLISEPVAKAARKLSEIRNDHAHANAEGTEDEAMKAIELLTAVILGSVVSLQGWVEHRQRRK